MYRPIWRITRVRFLVLPYLRYPGLHERRNDASKAQAQEKGKIFLFLCLRLHRPGLQVRF